jgi:two-component system cell cycle sensor histidine kinase/response regulator CckA
MNLVVNARDAMPAGASSTIETATSLLDAELRGGAPRRRAGRLRDARRERHGRRHGRGDARASSSRSSPPRRRARARGSGSPPSSASSAERRAHLGLQRARRARPSRSTCRTVDATQRAPSAARAAARCGAETMLLVEDEEQVRASWRCAILRRHGYNVLDARTAARLPHLRAVPGEDPPAPDRRGDAADERPELVERLAPLRPDMKVLYVSGYTDDAIVHHRRARRGRGLPPEAHHAGGSWCRSRLPGRCASAASARSRS